MDTAQTPAPKASNRGPRPLLSAPQLRTRPRGLALAPSRRHRPLTLGTRFCGPGGPEREERQHVTEGLRSNSRRGTRRRTRPELHVYSRSPREAAARAPDPGLDGSEEAPARRPGHALSRGRGAGSGERRAGRINDGCGGWEGRQGMGKFYCQNGKRSPTFNQMSKRQSSLGVLCLEKLTSIV